MPPASFAQAFSSADFQFGFDISPVFMRLILLERIALLWMKCIFKVLSNEFREYEVSVSIY